MSCHTNFSYKGINILRIIATQVTCTFIPAAMAAGPLVLGGATGNTPVKYSDPNIVFNVETGVLGSRSNDIADTLIRDAIIVWNSNSFSSIYITQGSDIPVDIDASNYFLYLPSLDGLVLNDNDGLNPIVYDDDGSIIDAYFGFGASDTVAGFASSIIHAGSSTFTEGYIVVNGKDLGMSRDLLVAFIAQQIGLYLGLDRTQANINNNESSFGQPLLCATADGSSYPLMYPYLCRDTVSRHWDDGASAYMLYPNVSMTQYMGQLYGAFLTPSGVPISGVNIYMQNTYTGQLYSIVSDYLKQNNGLFSVILPSGNYTIHANSINDEFHGGSSVGPYATSLFDLSFQPPASSIGEITYTGSTFTNPAIVSVAENEATTVVFHSDGSGSTSIGNAVVDPTLLDPDNDDLINILDNCPLISNLAQLDLDNDGLGDECDPDDDNDGVLDQFDAFPLDQSENTDTDFDGIGDNADQDDDNDGVIDSKDAFPLDSTRSVAESSGGSSGGAVSLLCLGLFGLIGLARRKV